MIKSILKILFKRFFGLFGSMAIVSVLAIGLLISFSSGVSSVISTYDNFRENYGPLSGEITMGFTEKSLIGDLLTIDGVEDYNFRLNLNAYLIRTDENGEKHYTITELRTFNDETDTIVKRHIYKEGTKSNDKPDLSISRAFAQNAGINVGEQVQISAQGYHFDVNVYNVVETPETIKNYAQGIIFNESYIFGVSYVNELELSNTIKDQNDQFIDLSLYTNDILIKVKDGYDNKTVIENVENYLKSKDISVNIAFNLDHLVSHTYMIGVEKQLSVAAIFLPVFFYIITIVIIILFLNQIIKQMTSDIGTMMSIGLTAKEISIPFYVFSLLMAIVSSILGIALGYGINVLLCDVFDVIYSMSMITAVVNPFWTIFSVATMVIAAEVATFISCRAIFKITPKDAMISNEAKRKNLPETFNKIIDKSPMNIKLGLNSIAQNPKRFAVSTFSMFAAFVMILTTLFFSVSKNSIFIQTIHDRINYQCQVYAVNKYSESKINKIKDQTFVSDVEHDYYAFLEISNGDKTELTEVVAIEYGVDSLVNIPNSNDTSHISVYEDGIILCTEVAKRLGVEVGDKVKINNKYVTVKDLSNQYFRYLQFMSKEQLLNLNVSYFSTLFMNVQDKNALLDYFESQDQVMVPVFSDGLSKDIGDTFKTMDIFINMLIVFSIIMGFVILAIMSVNSLLEQTKPISVMRGIGFRILDISNFWTVQSVLELVISTILAIPSGIVLSMFLFEVSGSARQVFPFIFDLPSVLYAFLFIAGIILVTHVFSMLVIRKWNLADNTRSRE